MSYLSQANYCLRRAALLLNERIWVENEDTAKGRAEHERVHDRRIERRGDLIKLYEYDVSSDSLGLAGKCDCIEARKHPDGCRIPGADFPVSLYPIEYKHGRVRDEPEYKIQLCAEAMCLEEMYHTNIPEAALFFISAHQRQTVPLDEALREQVRQTARELRRIRETFSIPLAEYSGKCRKCSLNEYCMPKTKQSAREYCKQLIQEATE